MQTVSEILSGLVRFPSICGQPNGAIVDHIRAYLSGYGVASHIIAGPEGDRFNLFATIGPQDRAGYVLSGHMDVVPVEGQVWTADPFKLRADGDMLIGRGALDMKGFLACVLAMVPEYVTMELAHPIHIAFSYDEELGCRGVPHLLRALGPLCHPPLGCIVGEPTEMRPVLSHKGKVATEVLFTGKAGHSSNPALGVNAIYPAAELALAIRDTQMRLVTDGPFDPRFDPPYSTLQAGILRGGNAVNIIPDKSSLSLEIRTIPAQTAADVLDPLLAGLETQELASYPALAPNDDHALADLLVRLTGKPAQQSVSYGTEAGLFQQAGIASIVCGPGPISRAHRPDEFILGSELAECVAMLRALGQSLQA